jgi:hypothetical protein
MEIIEKSMRIRYSPSTMLRSIKAALKSKSLSVFKTVVQVKINSSALKSAEYNKQTGKLKIVFKRGTVYEYDEVEKKTFYNLINSSSSGAYFVKHIRNDYNFVKLNNGNN